MKLFWIILFLSLPITSFAHGGFQKQVGNTVINISQEPLSPMVGEKVRFTFVFRNKNNEPLSNMEVDINVIDTVFDAPEKDVVIFTDKRITNANGGIDFAYQFEKENYFDIDFEFLDPSTGEVEETGFLVQPRNSGQPLLKYTLIAILGLAIGMWTKRT